MTEKPKTRSNSVDTYEEFCKAGWSVKQAAADLLEIAHSEAAAVVKKLMTEGFKGSDAVKLWSHEKNVRLSALKMYFDFNCTKPTVHIELPEEVNDLLLGIKGVDDQEKGAEGDE